MNDLMHTTSACQPFDDANWIFELKLSGLRAVLSKKNERISLYTKTIEGKMVDLAHLFPPIKFDTSLKTDVELDGHVVIVTEDGSHSPKILQSIISGTQALPPDVEVVFYAFDILKKNGKIVDTNLIERKTLLYNLTLESSAIKPIDFVYTNGVMLCRSVNSAEFCGVIAKHKKGFYLSENRNERFYTQKSAECEEQNKTRKIKMDALDAQLSALNVDTKDNKKLDEIRKKKRTLQHERDALQMDYDNELQKQHDYEDGVKYGWLEIPCKYDISINQELLRKQFGTDEVVKIVDQIYKLTDNQIKAFIKNKSCKITPNIRIGADCLKISAKKIPNEIKVDVVVPSDESQKKTEKKTIQLPQRDNFFDAVIVGYTKNKTAKSGRIVGGIVLAYYDQNTRKHIPFVSTGVFDGKNINKKLDALLPPMTDASISYENLPKHLLKKFKKSQPIWIAPKLICSAVCGVDSDGTLTQTKFITFKSDGKKSNCVKFS